MKKLIRLNLSNIILNKVFVFCIVASLIVFFMQTGYAIDDDMQYSVFELIFLGKKRLFEDNFFLSYDVIAFRSCNIYAFVFLPVLCTLPGILNYYRERNYGVLPYIKTRTNRSKWEIASLITNVLSAFLVLALSFSIYLFSLKLSFKGIEEFDNEIIALSGVYKITYEGFLLIIAWGMFGAFLAVLAHAFSRAFNSVQTVMGLLFTMIYAYITVLDIIMKMYLNKGEYDFPSKLIKLLPESFIVHFTNDMGVCLGSVGVLLILMLLMGFYRCKRSVAL